MSSVKSDETDSDNTDKKGEVNGDAELIYRIYSVISYFIILVIIGLPVWWFTTRVYRASLPLNKMFDVQIQVNSEKQFAVPSSLEYDVLISIVNPEPETIKLELDAHDVELALQPFLNTVQPVANFTVKSQWLYLVELGVIPKKVGDYYVLHENQLPHIITPLEKKLWSHLSSRPCINLVVYVAHCNAPLYIYDQQDEVVEANALLSSGWGGISILNPDTTSCKQNTYKPDLQRLVSIFITQLRKLLGIEGSTQSDINKFKQERTQDMIDSTKRTLQSLAHLLSEISSIVISDDVAYKIQVAVEAREKAEKFIEDNDVDAALKNAKIAYENAEAAFGDPSLLALLYFPDDQKYAVYIPLFLPVMIPVLMSLTTLRKWYVQSRDTKQKVD